MVGGRRPGERLKLVGSQFNWDTLYDPECSARTKYGKTTYGFGLQFVIDLCYGLVWGFAVFPSGQSFQPEITDFMLNFQRTYDLGEFTLTSDREFTLALALHQWEHERAQPILHYGPRAANSAKSRGIFTVSDFEVYKDYAICPAGKVLDRKPNMAVRRTNHEWRYRAHKKDCEGCALRSQCTTGKLKATDHFAELPRLLTRLTIRTGDRDSARERGGVGLSGNEAVRHVRHRHI